MSVLKAARPIVLLTVAALILCCFGIPESYAAGAATSITLKKIPKLSAKADSVTVIGDSVTLGAELFADMEDRIADTKGVSWCNVDSRGSRQLSAGVNIVKDLKKDGKLGKIVVYALATNGSFDYDAAKKARKAAGKKRYVIFVTGYNKGHDYTNESNAAMRKLAKNYKKVFVADWDKTIREHDGKNLSDGRCHLTSVSGAWYTNTVIKAVKKVRAAKKQVRRVKFRKAAKLSAVRNISVAVGGSVKAPCGVWGAHPGARKFKWTSSDEAVVSVNKKGKLTAVAEGKATITLTDTTGKKKTARTTVTVTGEKVDAGNIAVSVKKINKWACKISVTPGEQGATGVPTFTSSNKKIARVNRAGIVVGKATGKTRIKVKFGDKTKWVGITVG
jgi:hypothetical protein